jgi:hypothetical protein
VIGLVGGEKRFARFSSFKQNHLAIAMSDQEDFYVSSDDDQVSSASEIHVLEADPPQQSYQCLYDKFDVARMLLADSIWRSEKKWPLLNSSEIIEVGKRLESDRQQIFNHTDLLVINGHQPFPLKSVASVFRGFNKTYIFANRILNAFPGKIIAAGGAVFNHFIGKRRKHTVRRNLDVDWSHPVSRACDLDFFFIKCTKDEVETIIRFAWDILQGNVDEDGEDEVHYGTTYVSCMDRCQNNSTIYYSRYGDDMGLDYLADYGWTDDGGKMQFIHRSYPDPASVIGGFDLGPAMVFYDGSDFYSTPFGAWSIATQTIILDVSRRSTSFEHRINKYLETKICQLVIVNGSNTELYEYLDSHPNYSKSHLRYICPVKGFKIRGTFVPHGRYEGLDERIRIRREAGPREEQESDSEKDYAQGIYGFNFKFGKAAKAGEAENSGDESGDDDSASGKRTSPRGDRNTILEMFSRIGFQPTNMGGRTLNVNGVEIDFDDPETQDDSLVRQRKMMLGGAGQWRNKFRPAFSSKYNRVSDYDGGEFNHHNLGVANSLFASRGKIDCVTWRADDPALIFENPAIDFADLPTDLLAPQVDNTMNLVRLQRWFPRDKLAKIITGPVGRSKYVNISKDAYLEALKELTALIQRNKELAREKAQQGITLITENPGRQWTASHNPVVGNVRDYYHPALLQNGGPLLIGIPHDIFILLVCAWRKPSAGGGNTWGLLSRDVFRLLMNWLRRVYAHDGHLLLLGYVPVL